MNSIKIGFIDKIKIYLNQNKKFIFIILTLFFFGFLLGVFFAIKQKNYQINFIPDFLLKNYLKNNNLFNFIFFKCLLFFVLFAILYALSFFKFFKYLNLLFAFYISFCLGITFCILINNFCLIQAIIFSFTYLIFQFFINYILICTTTNFCNNYFFACTNCKTKKQNIKTFFCYYLLIIILILLQAIALLIISKLLFIN